jgi:hypothetical protein
MLALRHVTHPWLVLPLCRVHTGLQSVRSVQQYLARGSRQLSTSLRPLLQAEREEAAVEPGRRQHGTTWRKYYAYTSISATSDNSASANYEHVPTNPNPIPKWPQRPSHYLRLTRHLDHTCTYPTRAGSRSNIRTLRPPSIPRSRQAPSQWALGRVLPQHQIRD